MCVYGAMIIFNSLLSSMLTFSLGGDVGSFQNTLYISIKQKVSHNASAVENGHSGHDKLVNSLKYIQAE